MNGRFYVKDVIAKSSAAKAGLARGDQIIALLESDELFENIDFSAYSGTVKWLRLGREMVAKVVAEQLQIDSAPTLTAVDKNLAVLKISSFRKEYFKPEIWEPLKLKLKEYSSLIVDLRGNVGGDFNAAVKALSVFACEDDQYFGSLMTSPTRKHLQEKVRLEPNLTEDEFYEILNWSREIELRRFDGSVCYQGRLYVLIDNDSASVSEIFAIVLKEQVPPAQIWGQRSRGDMLLGVWYPASQIGKGYTLSIPEASYTSPLGFEIEGRGVMPEKYLNDRVEDWVDGLDSWIEQVRELQ